MFSGSRRAVMIRRGVILVCAAVLVVAAGLVWHHKTSPYHFLEVTPGVLYRSGRLHPSNLANVIDDYRIRTVVNLCSKAENQGDEWHEAEARVCREHRATLLDIPMQPETPPNESQVETWLSLLGDKATQPILVHCRHGVVRTGMMVAVYEMEFEHLGNDETLKGLPMFGHRLYVDHRKPFREFVLKYVPRLDRGHEEGSADELTPAGAAGPR